MNIENQRSVVPGSGRKPLPNARVVRTSDKEKLIRVSIFSRANPNPPAEIIAKAKALDTQAVGHRTYLTNDEFSAIYGAAEGDLDAIGQFATQAGLQVVDSSVPKRRVLVEGPIGKIETAFGTVLNDVEHPSLGRFRAREGTLSIPADLTGIIVAIEGLDTRPVGKPRRFNSRFGPAELSALRKTGRLVNKWPGTFFPPQIAGLYSYPSDLDGTGQNIAVFAFNGASTGDPRGGYSLKALTTYFETVLGGKTPSITDVVVQGPGNDPGPDTESSSQNGDSTGEVMLDLCVVGSVAPGAKIFVYFTEFDSQGWTEALQAAITDANNVSVISISYGNPEDDPNSAWTQSGILLVNQSLEAAKSKGITICCASGDDGSSDQGSNGAHADFPASSPWVLGVGGTSLVATTGSTPQIASEVVWNDLNNPSPLGAGGGGVSAIFSKPTYQDAAGVPPSVNPPHFIGRGVPDVAAVADPLTGVVVMHISGTSLEPIGGTSAAAPLWASLILRLNQGLGSQVGFLNTTLYGSLASGVLNDIVSGNNGAYSAGVGWDACTGFGSPNGAKLLNALKTAPV